MTMKNQTKKSKGPKASKQKFPRGWDEARVRRVIEHYENQTEEEAVAEDEAAMKIERKSMMLVPTELIPEIRRFIAKRRVV
jgi:hypothetical protein